MPEKYRALACQFDSNGNFITKWGSFGSGPGQFFGTYGITVATDSLNNVYVTSGYKVQKFTQDGGFLLAWGSYGSGDGQFGIYPMGMAIDSSDNVYVADCGNNRIQKFDSNGNFITKWGSLGSGNGECRC